MMNNIKKSILVKAVIIRLGRGESLENILSSYKKLTEAEKKEIKAELAKNGEVM